MTKDDTEFLKSELHNWLETLASRSASLKVAAERVGEILEQLDGAESAA